MNPIHVMIVLTVWVLAFWWGSVLFGSVGNWLSRLMHGTAVSWVGGVHNHPEGEKVGPCDGCRVEQERWG
jgi:hypothetical protein